MNCYIELKNVSRCYDSREVLSVSALKIEEKSIVSVTGSNGSGKTTLLRLLAMLDKPSEGDVNIRGCDPDDISMVMQSPFMFDASVGWNLSFGMRARNVSAHQQKKRIEEILEMLKLGDILKRKATRLSVGEKQRVGLARVLVLRPELLLLDEPTAHVDKARIGDVEEAIKWARSDWGATVVLATHNGELASRLSDKVISLIGGNLVDDFSEI